MKPKVRTNSRLIKDRLNSLEYSGEWNPESSLQSSEQDYSDQRPYVYYEPCSPLTLLKPIVKIGFIVPAIAAYFQLASLLFFTCEASTLTSTTTDTTTAISFHRKGNLKQRHRRTRFLTTLTEGSGEARQTMGIISHRKPRHALVKCSPSKDGRFLDVLFV